VSIELNRPEVLNGFNRAMAVELLNALQVCRDDERVRAVLLGARGRAFCSGQDLSDVGPLEKETPDLGKIVRETYNPIVLAIRNLEKPVVCAVNGVAAGAGANLAIACDIVLASREASFIQSFVKVGLVPDTGGSYTLPRLIGFARASALMMLGDRITAEQASQFGLIYKVCEPSSLREEALAMAAALAVQPTRAIGLTKRALNASLTNSLEAQLMLEEDLQRQAGASSDFKEGVSAFLEKRKPAFKGC
jgi:2-(1,2-epoxy-1,2-dihydrophenyl)acetyl-CoA isomerase